MRKRNSFLAVILTGMLLLGGCGEVPSSQPAAPALPEPSMPFAEDKGPAGGETLTLMEDPAQEESVYSLTQQKTKQDDMELYIVRICGGEQLEVYRQHDREAEGFFYEIYWGKQQLSIPAEEALSIQQAWAGGNGLWAHCVQGGEDAVEAVLCRWSWDGELALREKTARLLEEDALLCDLMDTERGLLLLTDTALFRLHEDLTAADQITFSGSDSFGVLLQTGTGEICCRHGSRLGVLDGGSFSFLAEYKVPSVYHTWPGSGAYGLFLTNAQGLYGVDLTKNSAKELLRWADVNLTAPERFFGQTETGYQMLWSNPFTLQNELLELLKIPPEQAVEKQELVLAVMESEFVFENSNTCAAIQLFNQRSGQYHITVSYYGDSAPEGEARMQRLKMDILTGEQIDLMLMDSLDSYPFISKGLLEDLYPWLDRDPSLSREDLSPSLLRAMERNEKLFFCAADYSVTGFVGNKALVGERQGWSLWDFADTLRTVDTETVTPIADCGGADFLYQYMMYCYDHFVDEEKGSCDFDSDEFYLLLELCRDSFPAQAKSGSIREGTAVLEKAQTIPVYGNLGADLAAFGPDAEWVGFPGAGGNGGVVTPGYDNFSMLSVSKHKEGAWEFLKFLWGTTIQGRGGGLGCPARLEAMERQLDRRVNETGQMTEEDAAVTREYYLGATAHSTYYAPIQNIVTEEAQAFLLGDKSMEETIRIIQNRSMIYLSEQS